MRRRYGIRPQRRTYVEYVQRQAARFVKSDYRRRSSDHHARKPELGISCEQAGESQARIILPHYKQRSVRNNIRTYSRSYTH